VWHSARADFASFDFLLEVIHRNVSPNIPAEVDQNGADPFQAIHLSRQIIVIFDLSGELLPLYSQSIAEKAVPEINPIEIGEGNVMSVEVACRPSKFSRCG
jgi:hypothetical protein